MAPVNPMTLPELRLAQKYESRQKVYRTPILVKGNLEGRHLHRFNLTHNEAPLVFCQGVHIEKLLVNLCNTRVPVDR